MSTGLTARQTQILKVLIDEYIETAEPIGSEVLEKKYDLGVSPATIRNEMASLAKMGYLRQPHTSAGRVPTPTAMKFYIDQLMEEKQMSLTDEVKAKEEVWDSRDDLSKLMREAACALSQSTNSLAISAIDNDRAWHSGLSNVFLHPEFADLEFSSSLFSFIEEIEKVHELFFNRMTGASPVEIIFGEELDWPGLSYLGVAGTRFKVKDKECALGVVGPARLSYSTVVPVLRYFRNMIQEITGS